MCVKSRASCADSKQNRKRKKKYVDIKHWIQNFRKVGNLTNMDTCRTCYWGIPYALLRLFLTQCKWLLFINRSHKYIILKLIHPLYAIVATLLRLILIITICVITMFVLKLFVRGNILGESLGGSDHVVGCIAMVGYCFSIYLWFNLVKHLTNIKFHITCFIWYLFLIKFVSMRFI